MHYRIKSVEPLPGMRLLVEFRDGTVKECSLAPYLDRWDALKPLLDPKLFSQVKVLPGGSGIFWNDDIDFPCNALWFDGVEVEEEEKKVAGVDEKCHKRTWTICSKTTAKRNKTRGMKCKFF